MINHRRAVPGRRVRPYSPFGPGEAQNAAQISRFDVCESTFSVYSQGQLQAPSASRLGPFRPKKLRPLQFFHPQGIFRNFLIGRSSGSKFHFTTQQIPSVTPNLVGWQLTYPRPCFSAHSKSPSALLGCEGSLSDSPKCISLQVHTSSSKPPEQCVRFQ